MMALTADAPTLTPIDVSPRVNGSGKVKVTLPGGELTIDWRERDDHVLMTGPIQFEFAGKFDPALFAKAGVP